MEIYSGDLNYQQLMILITAPHLQPEIMKEIFLGRALDWCVGSRSISILYYDWGREGGREGVICK